MVDPLYPELDEEGTPEDEPQPGEEPAPDEEAGEDDPQPVETGEDVKDSPIPDDAL